MSKTNLDKILDQIAEKSEIQSHEKMVDLYSQLIEKFPQNARVYALRGHSFYCQSSYEKAIMDFTVALKLKPDAISTRYMRARAMQHLDRLDDALSDFAQVIEYDPKAVDAMIEIGSIHEFRGDIHMARTFYEQALSIDENNKRARNGLISMS